MNTPKFLTAALAISGLLAIHSVQAEEPRSGEHLNDPADPGAVEHYHHEAYSHSYVDPNDHSDPELLKEPKGSGEISKARRHHPPGKPNTGPTIAFGGHRHLPPSQPQ